MGKTIQDLIDTVDGDPAILAGDATTLAAAQDKQQADMATAGADLSTLDGALTTYGTPVISVSADNTTARFFAPPGVPIVAGVPYPLASTVAVPDAPSSGSSSS
jgi:hypothetical protein